MSKVKFGRWLLAGLLGLNCWSPSLADWRPYAYSYGYMTAYQGEREIELYTDYDNKGSAYHLKNQIELEYGLTDRWMASIYGVISGSETSGYQYSKTKLETRLRFGEAGTWPVDPAIYLEYAVPADGSANTLEFKQILSKDWDDWNATVNLILEKELSGGGALAKSYTFGLSRQLTGDYNNIRLGLEGQGTVVTDPTFFLAPSVAVIWDKIKMNLAAGFGLTTASQSFYLRNIISWEF